MGKLVAVYKLWPANKLGTDISTEGNPNRPAWIDAGFGSDTHFVCYDGDDGRRTYYELRFGTVYLPIDASRREIIAAYGHIASRYEEVNENAYLSAGLIRRKVQQYCSEMPRALDIFAGTGIVANEISDLCESIDLVDISPEMIEVAKDKPGLADAGFYVCDVESFNFPQEYGLITCSNGLSYLDEDGLERVVAKAHASQYSGGMFINVGRVNTDIIGGFYHMVEGGVSSEGANNTEMRYFVGIK